MHFGLDVAQTSSDVHSLCRQIPDGQMFPQTPQLMGLLVKFVQPDGHEDSPALQHTQRSLVARSKKCRPATLSTIQLNLLAII